MKLVFSEIYMDHDDEPAATENTFQGEDVVSAIDAWAMWNANEAFDFRLPVDGTVAMLTANLRGGGDVLIIGGESVYKGALNGSRAFAFRFDLQAD